MFGTLLESSHRRRRRTRVAVLSVAAHAVAITLASAATRSGGVPVAPEEPDHSVIYQMAPPTPPAPRTAIGGGSGAAGRPTATDAPPSMPPIGPITIDLPAPTPAASTGGDPFAPVDGDERRGTGTGAGPVGGADGVFSVVERPAAVLPGAPVARYPDALQRAGIAGEVVLRFVVDTAGRVEPGSVVTVRATHPAFDASVRRALASTRYAPAEVGGRRVRQLVEQAFAFTLHE